METAVITRLKNILGTAAGFILAACVIVLSSSAFSFGIDMPERHLSMEEEPMISMDAIEGYRSGLLSKEDAMRRIDIRLNELVRIGAINSWEYTDGKYTIEMQNKATYVYYFD